MEEDLGLACWGSCAQRGLRWGEKVSYRPQPQDERWLLPRRKGLSPGGKGRWVLEGFRGWLKGLCPSDLFPRNLGTSWGPSPCMGMGVRGSSFLKGDPMREENLGFQPRGLCV